MHTSAAEMNNHSKPHQSQAGVGAFEPVHAERFAAAECGRTTPRQRPLKLATATATTCLKVSKVIRTRANTAIPSAVGVPQDSHGNKADHVELLD